ncbi:helix-turn-helix domain-containing protein [Nocardioides sp. JQ2195]|uniref:helix-turn-helix domain-containing protein n=1 Tax=Nocardioides sp. JQ2195 TaxID=2592334 RepID=UPI00143E34ED|nr:helix-turn-helix domain-containing protein [Nocardioides sp. JQ2195]QIX27473.1 helix-turn-helix domain-containing protein [Nocardioides sp. JQ2195]
MTAVSTTNYLDPAEMAERLSTEHDRVSAQWVRGELRAGRMQGTKIGRRWFIPEASNPAGPLAVSTLRSMVEMSGFTIEGIDDNMTWAQAGQVARELGNKLAEYRPATA